MADGDAKNSGKKVKPGRPELGSTYDLDNMVFAQFDGGAVYEYGWAEARDFDQMRREDGKSVTLLNVLTQPVRSAKWTIDAATGDTGEAAWASEFFNRPANNGGMSVPMTHVIGQATAARLYRKAFFEKVFDVDPLTGKIVYSKLAYRPQSTCGIRRDPDTASFKGFQQRPIRPGTSKNNNQPVNFEPAYSWVFINGQHLDPLRGHSDLDIAFWCYKTKQKLMFLWHTFCETQATPRTTVTSQDSTAAADNARKIARMKNGGVAGLTNGTDVNVLESNGTGAKVFMDAIQYLDAVASNSVLAGFTDLTTTVNRGASGSYALSKDATDFFLMASNSFANELAESISSYVVADLVKLNFGLQAACPRFTFAPLGESDLDTISSLMTTLAVAPQLNVPFELLGELTVRTAALLNLDEKKVEAALVGAGEQFAQRAKAATDSQVAGAKLAGQTGAAAAMVKVASDNDQASGSSDNNVNKLGAE